MSNEALIRQDAAERVIESGQVDLEYLADIWDEGYAAARAFWAALRDTPSQEPNPAPPRNPYRVQI